VKDWLPLIGVILAQFVVVGLFFAKQRGEDRRRWHDRRLDVYRRLSAAIRLAMEVRVSAEGPEDINDRRLVQAMNDGDSALLDIDFIATDLVRTRAEEVQTLLEMCVVIDAGTEAFPAYEQLLSARHAFENAVRQELGVDPRRVFVVEAATRTELLWRSLEVALSVFYGSLGRRAAARIRSRVDPPAERPDDAV
jgi:hypothetical protein